MEKPMLSKTSIKVRNAKPSAWGIGLIALDLILDADDPKPRLSAGGTCGNVMAILSRLGWNAIPIARLASGSVSDLVMSDLQRWHVDTARLHLRPTARPPIIVQRIRKDATGIPFHTFSFSCPNCGKRLPSFQAVRTDSVQELLSPEEQGPNVLFIDRVSRSSICLAESAVKRGAIIYFEPSAVSQKRLFDELLHLAHIVKYSQDRLFDFGELDWRPQMLLEIRTLGRGGLRFRTTLDSSQKRWRNLEAAQPLRVKDTAGCGDWLSGGLINSICRGGLKDLEARTFDQLLGGLAFGQGLAAWNCGFVGARGGMYSLSEADFAKLVRRLQTGKPVMCTTESDSASATGYEGLICDVCKPGQESQHQTLPGIGSLAQRLN
jgi:sugar/nucleoside kinase (ribokinase family)